MINDISDAEAKYRFALSKEKGAKPYAKDVQEGIANKTITHNQAYKLNELQGMMQKERQSRSQHIGKQDGNVGEHNTGKTENVIYEHKRNK